MTQLTYSSSGLPAVADERRLAEDLQSILGIVWRGWRYLAVSVLVCMTVAIFFAARIKPVYKGTARLLILQQGGRPLNIGGGTDPFRSADNDDYIPTHIMIIRSPLIVERAIALSKLKDLTVGEVIGRLNVTRPDPIAKILEISFQNEDRARAIAVVDAVMDSYKEFLDQNYHKSTNEVIALITKAKNELSLEVQDLEEKYLAFRAKHPVFTVAEDGRSLLVRKLDKWDQASNEAMIKEVQLKEQHKLASKLASEGMGMWAIANSLRMLGGGGEFVPSADVSGISADGSFDQVSAQLADLELKRQTAERLVEHLRAEQASSLSARQIPEDELVDAFYSEPEASDLYHQKTVAQDKLKAARRVIKNLNDPSLIRVQRQIRAINQDLARLWTKRRPAIQRLLAKGSNDEIDALIRRAEADLIGYKAEESVLRERLAALEEEPVRVARREGDSPAGLGEASKELARPRDPLRRPGQAQARVLLNSIERSLGAIKAMRAEMRQRFEADLAASKDTELDRLKEASLKNNLERHRAMFNSVMEQLKQAQLVSDYSSISAQILNPTGAAPGRPLAVLILFAALVFGCGLGIGCAFLADMLDARIRTLPEIRKALDLSVLGLIPQLSRDSDEITGEIGLISHAMPRSMVAESYKSIRTNLEFHRRSRRVQVLLITSPHSGDGKSTSASNLAISLAHAGRKVLLVDGDLRRPSQHHIFSLGRDRGLVHILKDLLPINLVVQTTPIENLDFISSGPDVPNPAELLASQRFSEFLETARQSYDIVIVDSPPLLAVTDPCVIGALVDAIVLVVRASTIKRHEAEQTVELLRTLETPVLGTVINGITREQSRYGYGYGGYGYSYGYGYGYGTYGNNENSRSIEESSTGEAGRSNGAPLPPVKG